MGPSARTIGRPAMSVLWPAFLMAGVLEMVVFALVDPASLAWFGGAPVGWSPQAVYTAAFLLFWAVISVAGALTLLLEMSPREINRGPEQPDEAPSG